MTGKNINNYLNGAEKLPTARDLRLKFREEEKESLTEGQKEFLYTTREILDALIDEKTKYGDRLETRL